MKKVLLEAPIKTQSGYGEHSRLVFKSLMSEEGLLIFINPLNWGATSWDFSASPEISSKIDKCITNLSEYVNQCKQQGVNPSFDMHIHVGIPSEYEQKADHSICVTAGIETDRVSPEWLFRSHKGMTKMIVPSEHAKAGLEQTSYEVINQQNNTTSVIGCGCPVEVVPYPVKNSKPKDLEFTTDTDFNFLSIALLGPRKNLTNMVDWFLDEFKDDNVGLILKTGRSAGGAIDLDFTRKVFRETMNKHKDRKCKVYLLHGDLEESEILSLYSRDDVHAYISTTHGEGYGLPIFEAACAGLPIVATNWSAHTEYLTADYRQNGKTKAKKLFAKVDYDLKEIPKSVVWKDILVEGSKWAYPKENSFKKQMRNMYTNHGMYKKWSMSLKEQLLSSHAEEKVLEMMRNSILNKTQEKQQEQVLIL